MPGDSGLSRSEYVRRRLTQDAAVADSPSARETWRFYWTAHRTAHRRLSSQGREEVFAKYVGGIRRVAEAGCQRDGAVAPSLLGWPIRLNTVDAFRA